MSAVSMLISWNFPSTGAGVYAACLTLPMSARASDAPHADVFELGELQNSVPGTFAADAAFLHAAERRDFRGDEAGVQADDSVLQGLGDAPRPREISRVDVG